MLILMPVILAIAALSPAAAAAAVDSVHDSEARTGAASAHQLEIAPTTFVSNHGQQDPEGFLLYGGGSVFQGFTTGGNPGGYLLSEVSVIPQQRPPVPEEVDERSVPPSGSQPELGDIATDTEPPATQLRVEIWSRKGINITMPDKLLYRMISPASVTLEEAVAFGAPPDAVLDPDTSYYVRIVNAIQVGWDMDREADSGTAVGWSLERGLMYQSEGANAWTTFVPNAVVAISGTALRAPAE